METWKGEGLGVGWMMRNHLVGTMCAIRVIDTLKALASPLCNLQCNKLALVLHTFTLNK